MEEAKKHKQRGGARPKAGRKARFPGGSEMVRIPRELKDKVIAFLDLYGEYVLESKAPQSRSDEQTRRKLIEDMKGMIEYEKNRLKMRADEFDRKRQTSLPLFD